ncbi:unnamed protein product, partial [marine sediment metagenome]
EVTRIFKLINLKKFYSSFNLLDMKIFNDL